MRVSSGFENSKKLLLRKASHFTGNSEVERTVEKVIADVIQNGDKAVREYSKEFDGVTLDEFEVTPDEIQFAVNNAPLELVSALRVAGERIRNYHLEQYEAVEKSITFMKNRQMLRSLNKVGIYAPGGKAYYPSTVLMTAIPAKVAGVENVILATPPGPDGNVPAPTLAAAAIAGVDRVFRIGGAQAVAAMAFGTMTVPQVDKICGPGNIYVMTAKRLVYGSVAIDGLQGPSEVLIIADETADPAYCAGDILAQAEHDPMAQSILITTSKELAHRVIGEIRVKIKGLERRDIIEKSLEERGLIAVVDFIDEAIELSNIYAPEHLIIFSEKSSEYLHKIKNAGCVFTGNKATVAVGDYIAGPSHALPTGGTARFSSPLNVLDFVKLIDVVYVDDTMLDAYGSAAVIIARAEGLESHARAIETKLEADTK